MSTRILRHAATAAAAVLFGALAFAAPAAAGGYGIQDRGPSIAADLVALLGVATGAFALALTRGRFGGGSGRIGSIAAMGAGLVGIVIAVWARALSARSEECRPRSITAGSLRSSRPMRSGCTWRTRPRPMRRWPRISVSRPRRCATGCSSTVRSKANHPATRRRPARTKVS